MENIPTTSYKAGQCNIGEAEIKKRLRIGYVGLITSIIFIILAETFQFPTQYKLLLFFPVVYCISGFLQAYHKHCFIYGYFGMYNMIGKRSQVEESALRLKDRRKALSLFLQIIVASLLVTLLYYFTT